MKRRFCNRRPQDLLQKPNCPNVIGANSGVFRVCSVVALTIDDARIQSARRTLTGSTALARRAGTQAAAPAAIINIIAVPAQTIGSCGSI